MRKTTIGQILINDVLPPDLRDYARQLDQKGIQNLLSQIGRKYPDKYATILRKLTDISSDAAFASGGLSFGLKDLKAPEAARRYRYLVDKQVSRILASKLPNQEKYEAIKQTLITTLPKLQDDVFEELKKNKNPLAYQVLSGARGNKSQLNRLIGGDLIYKDHNDDPIPYPILHSLSEGLRAAEYWSGVYSGRRGLVDVKLATPEGGSLAKQLNQASHRLMVVAIDSPGKFDPMHPRGLPVNADDPHNDGALLAAPVAGFPRNTIITPEVRAALKAKKIENILIRSPIVGGPAIGGLYARDVGVREKGRLPDLGELVGLSAAQAITERLTQMQIASKHFAGILKQQAGGSGFRYLNQMMQVPKYYPGGAAHAQLSGSVTDIKRAPAGGWFVYIDGMQHFVGPNFQVTVKKGDTVEAGDMISTGYPNPAEIVKHKGIGEGRRFFTNEFTRAYKASGFDVERRNVELLARALINFVQFVQPTESNLQGDIVPYNSIEATWKPRAGARFVPIKQAVGKYLESPVLHHTIGTQLLPSMIKELEQYGIKDVYVHDDPPPFRPIMIRAMSVISHDPDWMTRLLGVNQKRSLLSAVRAGGTSELFSTSFVPSLAEGVSFGKDWPKEVLRRAANT